jgi:hypothetical protein
MEMQPVSSVMPVVQVRHLSGGQVICGDAPKSTNGNNKTFVEVLDGEKSPNPTVRNVTMVK